MSMFKTALLLATSVFLLIVPSALLAGGPDSGFYFGGSGQVQFVPGSGTWGPYDFEIGKPLSSEDGEALGFSWTDKALLGIKPVVGYKLGSALALQVGYTLNIAKTSQQSYAQTDGLNYYEQGLTMEWKQRSLEILAVYHPNADLDYYFFGGVDLTRVDMNVLIFEGVESQDFTGNPTSIGDYQEQADHVRGSGFILGGGLQWPSADNKKVVFASAQYSTARTKGEFFGTDDFKVDVGGISVQIGIKLFPFYSQ